MPLRTEPHALLREARLQRLRQRLTHLRVIRRISARAPCGSRPRLAGAWQPYGTLFQTIAMLLQRHGKPKPTHGTGMVVAS